MTLTLTPAVVAGETVVVNYTPGARPVQDLEGQSAARLTNYPVTSNTPSDPPRYLSGVVDGNTLTLAYDEDLDTGSEPAPAAYAVTADGTTHTVNDVDIGGMTVTLMLSSPVLGGQTVRLSYAPPPTDPLQDLDGEDAAQLTNVTITNSTGVAPEFDSAEVDGDTLTLTYNEPLDGTSEPATTAYRVTVGGSDRGVTGVSVSDSMVTLTLASAVVGGETVLVSYDSSQATNPVQDAGGTAAGDLTNESVDNITNNAPVFTTTSFTIGENTPAVGTVVAVDVDTQDSVDTYILKAAVPEDDGQRFTITNAGLLKFKDVNGADYEQSGAVDDGNVYRVTVMATSGTGARARMPTQQVTVTITNADEAGELRFSSEQPQVGTALLATVKDPDGGVSVTTWAWEISSDKINWDPLSSVTNQGSDSSAYSPVAADENKYIRVTADYTDAVTGADQVQRTLMNRVRLAPGSNSAPTFPSSATERSVAENTSANMNIGLPVIATDPDGDLLTYSLDRDDTDAASFDIIPHSDTVPLSGQLRTLAPLDFEEKSSYTVTVIATDPSAKQPRSP